ncbi:MAG: hypothetical protein ACR2ME_03650 [Acidimicrobiia bacterium]
MSAVSEASVMAAVVSSIRICTSVLKAPLRNGAESPEADSIGYMTQTASDFFAVKVVSKSIFTRMLVWLSPTRSLIRQKILSVSGPFTPVKPVRVQLESLPTLLTTACRAPSRAPDEARSCR